MAGASDYMVGNAPAGASYQMGNMADQLYKMIGGLADDYRKGADFKYQQQQRNLFSGGVPTTNGQPNGPIDTGTMMRQIIQAGGAPGVGAAGPLIDLDAQTKFYDELRRAGGSGPQPPNTGPGTSNHTGPANLTGDFSGGQPSPTDNAGGESVRTLTAGIAGGVDVPPQKLASFAAALGVDPDTPLSAQQERLARKLIGTNLPRGGGPVAGASGRKTVMSTGYEHDENNTNDATPVGSTGGAQISPNPQGAGPGVGETFDSRSGAAQPSTPIGTLADANRHDEMATRYNTLASAPRITPAQAAAAKAEGERHSSIAKEIRSQLGEYGKPATNPQVQGSLKQYEGAGAAVGKRIGEAVESGGTAARHTVNILNTIEESLRRGGDHMFTGPGNEMALKVKQAAANLGYDIKGTTESEVVQKLNTQLASAAAKAMTARPSQLEFLNFVRANPGLMTSTKGSLYLISVLRQATEQDIGLSRKAMDKRNWDSWGSVEDAHYKANPIKSPFSGKPLAGDEAIPGAGGGGAPASGRTAPPRYQWTPDGGLRAIP
jgi:hypothetical protein